MAKRKPSKPARAKAKAKAKPKARTAKRAAKATSKANAKPTPKSPTKPKPQPKAKAPRTPAKRAAAKPRPATRRPARTPRISKLDTAIAPGGGAMALDRELGGVVAHEVEAEAALQAGELDRAIAIYTHLIESSASPIASSLIARGRAFYRAGDHPRAIADFERGLALEPHYPDLYFDKGKAELHAGLIAEAEASFGHDIALDPSPISFYNRHLARKALGNPGGALADLDAAVEGLPDEPALRISRAIMRHTADDHAGAFEDADAAASLDPEEPLHLDLCGRFALLAGHDARAAEAYTLAIRIADTSGDPPNPQHLHGLGLALAGLGRAAEALALFDRAIALAPDDASFACNRGWTLHQQGRDPEALAELDRALALDATYAQALRNRAAIYAGMGDRGRALADYRALDALGHDVTDAIARLI